MQQNTVTRRITRVGKKKSMWNYNSFLTSETKRGKKKKTNEIALSGKSVRKVSMNRMILNGFA